MMKESKAEMSTVSEFPIVMYPLGIWGRVAKRAINDYCCSNDDVHCYKSLYVSFMCLQ